MILPSLFIIIGIAFLLKNLGYISGSTWGIIWPVFFIVLGIGILLRKGRDDFFLAPLEKRLFCRKSKRAKEE